MNIDNFIILLEYFKDKKHKVIFASFVEEMILENTNLTDENTKLRNKLYELEDVY